MSASCIVGAGFVIWVKTTLTWVCSAYRLSIELAVCGLLTVAAAAAAVVVNNDEFR